MIHSGELNVEVCSSVFYWALDPLFSFKVESARLIHQDMPNIDHAWLCARCGGLFCTFSAVFGMSHNVLK
jgi:hypothetical protein